MDNAQGRPSVVRMRDQPEISDPPPPVTPATFWRQASQVATVGIFVIMFGAFLDLARAVVLPIVSAAVISTMLNPLGRMAAKRGIPSGLFATAAVGFFLLLAQGLTVLVTAPLIDWIGRMPELAAALRTKLDALERGMAVLHSLLSMFGAAARPARRSISEPCCSRRSRSSRRPSASSSSSSPRCSSSFWTVPTCARA